MKSSWSRVDSTPILLVSLQKGEILSQQTQAESHMKVEAEMGVMHLYTEEHQ